MTRPTIKEVAQLAGVSQSTVSRAMCDPSLVKKETVAKVQQAAKALNYVYNATAGNLSSRKTNAIGVIMPSPAYSAFAINLVGIQDVCSRFDFSCRIASSAFNPESERMAMRKFYEQRVSGLIMAGIDESNIPYLKTIEDSGIPTLVLWECPGKDFNYIAINNFRAAYEAVSHLIHLGHVRMALLCGLYTCAHRNMDRLAGFRAAHEEHGLQVCDELIHSRLPTFLDGKCAMRHCLQRSDQPTAVLCVSDYLAIGAIRAIHEEGLRVPDDISVCGFDDVDISAYFNPPITTMKTPGELMGRMAAEEIITALNNGTKLNVQYLLDAELVVRKSCAPCKTITKQP